MSNRFEVVSTCHKSYVCTLKLKQGRKKKNLTLKAAFLQVTLKFLANTLTNEVQMIRFSCFCFYDSCFLVSVLIGSDMLGKGRHVTSCLKLIQSLGQTLVCFPFRAVCLGRWEHGNRNCTQKPFSALSSNTPCIRGCVLRLSRAPSRDAMCFGYLVRVTKHFSRYNSLENDLWFLCEYRDLIFPPRVCVSDSLKGLVFHTS